MYVALCIYIRRALWDHHCSHEWYAYIYIFCGTYRNCPRVGRKDEKHMCISYFRTGACGHLHLSFLSRAPTSLSQDKTAFPSLDAEGAHKQRSIDEIEIMDTSAEHTL